MWLTVDGRGNFQNSPELKTLVRNGMAEGTARMIVDLQRCSGMDSTFMGMLSCVAVKLEGAGGCLQVVNAVGKNGDLLRGLGLDAVFAVEDGMASVGAEAAGGESPPAGGMELAEVPRAPCTKQGQREICLEAHEALAELQEANANKFRDVLTLMRQESHPAAASR